MSEMFVASLRQRIGALNALWQRAVSDLTLEQVNHQEREHVLPIAFSLSHFMRSQDQAVSAALLREPPLWQQGGWAAKIGVTVDLLGREESIEEMEVIRFGDLDAFRAFQTDVIARTTRYLESVTEETLAEVVMAQLPANFQETFCFMVIGPGAPLRKLEILECFVYQHGLRHMGEIEHGRALVGLTGLTR